MLFETTKFGSVEVNLTNHKRKKGLNNIVESILKEIKKTTRLTNQEHETLHNEIRERLLRNA